MKTVKAICSSNSVLRKFIMNLFVRELIVVVVIAVQCVSYKEVMVPVQED